MHRPAPEIFKAYDIRGIVDKSLTIDTVRAIGQALGSEARVREQKTIVIGRDGRHSGPDFAKALAEGINAAGIDVIDVGCVATPLTCTSARLAPRSVSRPPMAHLRSSSVPASA